MTEGRDRPHLFGLAKIEDADTLHQAIHGWWPGIDEPLPEGPLAGVDALGEPFLAGPGADVKTLPYPVHVINAVVLPAQSIKPAADARPYQR